MMLTSKQGRFNLFHELHCAYRKATSNESHNAQTRSKIRYEFDRMLTDHVAQGNIREYTIHIDPVSPLKHLGCNQIPYKVVAKCPIHMYPDYSYTFTSTSITIDSTDEDNSL